MDLADNLQATTMFPVKYSLFPGKIFDKPLTIKEAKRILFIYVQFIQTIEWCADSWLMDAWMDGQFKYDHKR